VTIPWERAANRVEALMAAGQFISRDRFDEALDNERLELAGRLWYFYRDDMKFMPDGWKAEKGGNPEDEALIKALLDDPDERQTILDRLEADVARFNSDEHERVWHDPDRLLADMRDAMLPPAIFPDGVYRESRDFKRFITQDEIDAFLTRGSAFNEGKFRVLSIFLTGTSNKERIDFLKNEYGTGGGTWSDGNGWSDHSPSGGLTLKRDGTIFEPEASVTLTWNAAAKRIEKLIGDGRYMSKAEYERVPRYERLMLVRRINRFYSDLPEEYKRPFAGKNGFFADEYRDKDGNVILNFHYPGEAEWQAIRDLLDDPERMSATLSDMRRIFENTAAEDRDYDSRKIALEHLTAFQEGAYTLFPGLERLPEPGAVTARLITPPAAAETPGQEMFEDMRESRSADHDWGVPRTASVQMSMFDFANPLPSVDEQREKIDQ
jgi:hypothetical protein